MGCQHLRTRCVHIEEAESRRFRIRFWFYPKNYRQLCLNCKTPLDREMVCTRIRPEVHEWTGPWDRLR